MLTKYYFPGLSIGCRTKFFLPAFHENSSVKRDRLKEVSKLGRDKKNDDSGKNKTRLITRDFNAGPTCR